MGLKKYEIITVGSDKRVRALRSWAVGGRYVNIGDVGGIVYDEKTLSQDGACWLFKGNFGFPGARIGGDSIVDVGEATLSATGAPNVDILGSSVVVGGKLRFVSDLTATDAVVLTADDFEQGGFNYAAGVNWETMKVTSASYIRSKAPIFSGGVPVTVKCAVEGYTVQAYILDRDGNGMAATEPTNTGAGVTITVPAGQYFVLRLAKKPGGAIVPADATAAQITFTGTYETSLSIIDSRLEVGPADSAALAILKPGGTHSMKPGAKYPEAIIRNSKVTMNASAAANRTFRIRGQIIGSTATLDATTGDVTIVGKYSNVKSLMASGLITTNTGEALYDCIQATDCNDFAVSPTIFPGFNVAYAARVPFIFQGCNVPGGRFYHRAQIANAYKNIDFALAQADLGKVLSGGFLVSSEVEGMYRIYRSDVGAIGSLVESYGSVSSLVATGATYGTTIYKDAYLNGKFDIAGTNVFGNKVRSHPLAQVLNVQPRAVQGAFNTVAVGETITGVVASANRVCVPLPFRVNGAKGLTVNCPTGVEGFIIYTDINGVIKVLNTLATGESSVPAARLVNTNAYLMFKKTDDSPITPEDLAGVTVTVYNGCKIVNTGATAVIMKGNIRVEDNATLLNSSITGTGYFGGNCEMSGVSISGCAYMRDNASIIRTVASGPIRDLKMTDNAKAVLGDVALNGRIHLSDNARFTPTSAGLSEGDLVMKDNAVVSGAVTIGGVLTVKDNAKASAGALSTYGDITLCGSYNQTVSKSWVGKRVIDNENGPEYDDNVKTQYDF